MQNTYKKPLNTDELKELSSLKKQSSDNHDVYVKPINLEQITSNIKHLKEQHAIAHNNIDKITKPKIF